MFGYSAQELTADKSRLDEVNTVALKLIGEGHSGEHIIREHQASLNTKYVGQYNTPGGLCVHVKTCVHIRESVHSYVRMVPTCHCFFHDNTVMYCGMTSIAISVCRG